MSIQEKLAKHQELAREANKLLQEIKEIQSTCAHQWGPTVFAHEEEGDIPVPAPHCQPKFMRGWRRICTTCGLKQYTTKLKPGNEADFS